MMICRSCGISVRHPSRKGAYQEYGFQTPLEAAVAMATHKLSLQRREEGDGNDITRSERDERDLREM